MGLSDSSPPIPISRRTCSSVEIISCHQRRGSCGLQLAAEDSLGFFSILRENFGFFFRRGARQFIRPPHPALPPPFFQYHTPVFIANPKYCIADPFIRDVLLSPTPHSSSTHPFESSCGPGLAVGRDGWKLDSGERTVRVGGLSVVGLLPTLPRMPANFCPYDL